MTKYVNSMLSYLEAQGKQIIIEAKSTKTAKNDTYNQYDAYGYLVYYNGVLKRWSISPELADKKHKGWPAENIPAAKGSEWAEMFKNDFNPPRTGFTLVVFNAAFYSMILEKGNLPLKRKYKIISQVIGSMKDIKDKFSKASLTGINIDVS